MNPTWLHPKISIGRFHALRLPHTIGDLRMTTERGGAGGDGGMQELPFFPPNTA